ncbi:THUMP domain-containing protein 2 isoform X1, partial [Tachysurus ichikawai]
TPLSAASVDVVVCDVPFGRKFSCGVDMTTALPHILAEMERVLRDGGTLVLLLSLQLSVLIKKLIKSRADEDPHATETDAGSHDTEKSKITLDSLLLQSKHRVSLGTTDALIHTYTKRHTT